MSIQLGLILIAVAGAAIYLYRGPKKNPCGHCKVDGCNQRRPK